MEFLKIWNDYGQSYINHIKDMERESAVKAATLTAKLCSSAHKQRNNQIANYNHHHDQNDKMNENRTTSPPTTRQNKTTILSPTTTLITSSASLTIPSPPASHTSSNASSPGSSSIQNVATPATSSSSSATTAATAVALLHLQKLQQQQFEVEQAEQKQQEQEKQQQQQRHHQQQQQHKKQMQHHHELLQQQQQQNFHHAQQAYQHHHHAAAAAAAAAAVVYNQQHQKQQHQHQFHDDSHVTNSLLWQPWRDLQQAAAVHHCLYQQQLRKEARLTAKELPTSKWRRERRMRTAEYHTMQGSSAAGSSNSSSISNPAAISPPPLSAGSSERLDYVLHPVPHNIAVAVGATPPTSASPLSVVASAAANMRPLCESNNRLGALAAISMPATTISVGGGVGSSGSVFIPQHAHQHSMQTLHHQQQQQFLLQQQQQQQEQGIDCPLDMTVPHSLKQRSSPPPPYREPLPGSLYSSTLARPSVITQAPSKRHGNGDDGLDLATNTHINQMLISNRENENQSAESLSMCENVIDEHFRRSLGADYAALFGKRSPAQSPQPAPPQPQEPHLHTTPSSPQSPLAMLPTASHMSKQVPLHTAVGMQPPPPAYHQTNLPTHPLISPKPAAVLLSPAAIAAASAVYIKDEQRNLPSPLLPPQQQQQIQPLSLHRSASNSPGSPTAVSPQPLIINNSSDNCNNTTNQTLKNSSHMQRLAAKRRASPQPISLTKNSVEPQLATAIIAQHHSPTLSPSHTPPVVGNITSTTAAASSTVVLPAIMRIKTEPGLPSAAVVATTTTPPASPNSASNASITNSDVLASVDDHFAKALGDTWKKLQERK